MDDKATKLTTKLPPYKNNKNNSNKGLRGTLGCFLPRPPPFSLSLSHSRRPLCRCRHHYSLLSPTFSGLLILLVARSPGLPLLRKKPGPSPESELLHSAISASGFAAIVEGSPPA